jgi:3-phosphoshikimate 1-carboxyvinyltransferase
MKLIIDPATLRGEVDIPGSKSHTIRAVAIASLAEGESTIRAPLDSADTRAAVAAYRALGAGIETGQADQWTVAGTGGQLAAPAQTIDVGNSGTTLRIAVGSAALLGEGVARLTGDAQIQRRPLGPLIRSLNDLGAQVTAQADNDCAPLTVAGRLTGGRTRIEAITSQYLTSLLINCPLAENDTQLDVPVLNEKPYVGITLDWLTRAGVSLEAAEDYARFRVPGGQRYSPFDVRVAADFSSATFFLCAGAIGDNQVTSRGLDINDPQGDKAVVDYLSRMGAAISIQDDRITVSPGRLTGCELDLNNTPDALPMLAALACFAQGSTHLVNVPQARIKETDRISVMAEELGKMGAQIEELPDGLVVHASQLRPAVVDGHDDHRVVMALAIAATAVAGQTTITSAEAINVTFPTFVDCLRQAGGRVDVID